MSGHWFFVMLSYAVVACGFVGLVFASWIRRRRINRALAALQPQTASASSGGQP